MKKALFTICCLLLCSTMTKSWAQPEWRPWGNIAGIRVEGQLMPFETSLRAVDPDWGGYVATDKYNTEGRIDYQVLEKGRKTYHWLESMPLFYTSHMLDEGTGKAYHDFVIDAKEDIDIAGLYYCIELPSDVFNGAKVEIGNKNSVKGSTTLADKIPSGNKEYLKAKGNTITISTADKHYTFTLNRQAEVIVRQDLLNHPHYLNDPYPRQRFVDIDPVQPSFDYKKETADYQIYFTIKKGGLKKGFKQTAVCYIDAQGNVDKENVNLSLESNKPGRTFDGISGNFRWQFPDKDQEVIDYNLKNLRVTWGRVAFLWGQWQPEEQMDPIENAKAGNLDERFVKQMELTAQLARNNIPIMVSVWDAPKWAIDNNRKNERYNRGYLLDLSKMDKISKSIADYLIYIKDVYGVETVTFSFNESDVGVQVFQTAEDHLTISKKLVEYFNTVGLKTKILLGDTGHGTAQANYNVVRLVENDPEVQQYGAAVSFHTYHGCRERDLKAWANTAKKTNLPIIVAEGGPDSSAHRYEKMFLDEWFQLSEADLYIRICNAVEPFSIMPWQLTKDYSVLIGDGIYGDNGPLRPTMRFWILKQLGMSPQDAFWLPIKADKENVSVAANGDISEGIYTVHIVNNGPTRTFTLTGLPKSVGSMQIYTTNIDKGMEQGKEVKVENGCAQFEVEELSYVSLINNK